MNLYIGSSKQIVRIGSSILSISSPSEKVKPVFDGTVLKSSDNYRFRLADDSYLTVEKS